MSFHRRLERLEEDLKPEPSHNPEVRARMKAVLDEIAAARREGRAPSEEAAAIGEAIERRRARGD